MKFWVLLIAIYFLGPEIHWGSMLGDALLLWRRLFLAMVSSFSNFLWNAIWTLGFALLCLLYGICCIIHLPNHDEKLVIIKFCLLLDRNLMFLVCLSIVLLIFLYRSYGILIESWMCHSRSPPPNQFLMNNFLGYGINQGYFFLAMCNLLYWV
jgi:hypothetical protein